MPPLVPHPGLARLRQRLPPPAPACNREPVAFGHAPLDSALGGGLARGRLHELFAPDAGDAPAAIGLALGLAARAAAPGQPLWIRPPAAAALAGRLHPPGLAALAPQLPTPLLISPATERDLLRAIREATAAGGTVIAESWGRFPGYDLTASRRLQLAAEGPGSFLLLLRLAATPVPSAAETRWQVAALPSVPLEAGAPGHPAFCLTLLRRRGGAAGQRWQLAWHHDEACFHLPGAVPALAPRRADAPPLRLAR